MTTRLSPLLDHYTLSSLVAIFNSSIIWTVHRLSQKLRFRIEYTLVALLTLSIPNMSRSTSPNTCTSLFDELEVMLLYCQPATFNEGPPLSSKSLCVSIFPVNSMEIDASLHMEVED